MDKNYCRKVFILISVFILLSVFTSCASGSGRTTASDDKPFENVSVNSAEAKNKYSEYLVDIKTYSTNGAYYQNKYENFILSVIAVLTEKHEFDISKKSTGFYFDKRSNRTDRLYFGFDVEVVKDNNLDYGRFSTQVIKENVETVLSEIFRYERMLNEQEIAGLVIGFKWREGRINQQVNIWIKKEDMLLARQAKITVNEMYQRSTITNSEGKIILLPI
jgi:hypothetical protein